MCGFAGFLDTRQRYPQAELLAVATAMADRVRHRGPDDGGAWADEAAGVALGFRRLAIVDLSPAGHQPMVSASGRSVIVFNGEIYNAAELRAELEAAGLRPRGRSDTEVLLEACEAWGVPRTARRLIGMFAFALWDRAARRLTLARDRVGIKPLYLATGGGMVFFGSQLKSFHAHPDWRPEVDRTSLAAYMRFAYMPGRRSIFAGCRQVAPGGIVTVDETGAIAEETFWSGFDVALQGRRERFAGSEAEAIDALDTLVRDAVARRMVADVPLGAFLSGGIDSSLVTAAMQAQSPQPVKTFSIGFAEQSFDEAPYARAIARHLGTDHHELYVAPSEALDLVPRLADWYDEPFADASQMPTLLVSALARRMVTVTLSGDGGDELFGGYPRYDFAARFRGVAGLLPAGARRGVARLLQAVPTGMWDALAAPLPAALRPERVGDRVHKGADWFAMPTPEALYRRMVSQWEEPVVPGAGDAVDPVWLDPRAGVFDDVRERCQLVDLLTYLPDDILAKVDRASMAVSLEARVPLLDHRIVEFAWRLPPSYKGRPGASKWILRRVLARYVPTALFERPKMGFEVPLAQWLRGPLADWAEDLLSEASLSEGGFLSPAPIRRRWLEHRSGRRNWQYALWTVLMFQEWRRRWLSGAPSRLALTGGLAVPDVSPYRPAGQTA
ncbi:MAG TPA: asparagine synthase (glutamine-hydrolyzing) [Azospirillum sp.]|nr:asparagine synthase (glutamine-hydrolyzing) [Azospirillum sp.]